jgi:hypothetical protein
MRTNKFIDLQIHNADTGKIIKLLDPEISSIHPTIASNTIAPRIRSIQPLRSNYSKKAIQV